MGVDIVNLYQGGDLTSRENQPFVREFMRLAVAPTEQNQMSRDNQLTKEGVSRMQGAILAAAYDDTRALAVMLDSTDDNIKAISNAMLAAAPKNAKLKAEISAGRVSSEFDITDNVTDVANKISNARKMASKLLSYWHSKMPSQEWTRSLRRL